MKTTMFPQTSQIFKTLASYNLCGIMAANDRTQEKYEGGTSFNSSFGILGLLQ